MHVYLASDDNELIYIRSGNCVYKLINIYMSCPVVFNFYKLCLIHLSLFFFVTIRYNMFELLCSVIIYGIHQHHRKLFCLVISETCSNTFLLII